MEPLTVFLILNNKPATVKLTRKDFTNITLRETEMFHCLKQQETKNNKKQEKSIGI